MSARPIIEVRGLSKTFRTFKKAPGVRGALRSLVRREYEPVHAVKDVHFTVNEGEFVGFLGPNGAGKTTTLKMLSGLLHPTSGDAKVLGYVPWERADGYRRQFALLLGQKNQLWWDLPASESLALNARIYGIAAVQARKTVDELTELLDVRAKLDVMVRELSLGERMKMELIASLLHGPKVLFLDEPTIGLDAPSKLAVRDFVKTLNREKGVTVLLTTHDMHDIEALAQRVIVIGNGAILADQPFETLRAGVLAERRLFIDFAGQAPAITLPGVREVARDGASLELAFDPKIIPAPALIARIAADHAVEDIHVEQPAIEEVIARFYEQHGAGEA